MKQYVFLLLTLMLTLSPWAAAQPDTYRLDLRKADLLTAASGDGTHWEGWGTSLCWWANRVGYDPALTKASADLFFNKDKGLGLNIMRYNIGGGDDPSHHHITRTDSDVPGWLYLDADGGQSYHYDADSCQLNVLRAAAHAAGDDAWIEVFSNSPPYFMTQSGCSSGNVKATDNNLKEDAYEAFAEYLAHVTHYMCRKLHLDIRSISPMNEPNTDYWSAMSRKQEGCHFDAGGPQSRILVETDRALKRYGIQRIQLVGSDETNPALQVEELKQYSPEARAALDRISAHTYSTSRMEELAELVRKERINLWMSETDGAGTSGERAGEMGSALWMAEKIISDIRGLKPSAWVMWQVIDTHVSSAGWKGRRDSGPLRTSGGFWGLACANHDTHEIQLSQKYYALGQFSRYIRPGADLVLSRLETEAAADAPRKSPCQVLSAWDRRHKQLTVVCTNASAATKTLSINAADFGLKRGSADAYRTSGSMSSGEHWSAAGVLPIQDGRIQAELAPNSITTFVLHK